MKKKKKEQLFLIWLLATSFRLKIILNEYVDCRYISVSVFCDLYDPIVLVGIFPVTVADMHGIFISVQASCELHIQDIQSGGQAGNRS
jgi:hypothetical protein